MMPEKGEQHIERSFRVCYRSGVTRKVDAASRSQLLDRIVAYAFTNGVASLSLRPLAKELGVSAGLLLYHFRSKEELTIEILKHAGDRQRELFARLREREFETAHDVCREVWRVLAAPEARPLFRLFFEVYGLALVDPQRFPAFFPGAITNWLEFLERPFMSDGGRTERSAPARDDRARGFSRLPARRVRDGRRCARRCRRREMDRVAAVLAAPARRARTAGASFIFVTMLFDWLVVGILTPVLPKLIVDFTNGHVDRASAISGGFATAFALVQFFASPILGLLSDRFGRRPIILLSSLGSAVDCTILALAPNLWWLFVGRLLSGGTAASATSSAAYIADVTTPERRAAAFGMVSAAFGLGFALGPALGGLLAGLGSRVPFVFAAGLMLANAAYGFFVLPESLPPEKRQTSVDWKRANPLGSLKLLRRHRDLFSLVLSLFCSNLAVQSFSVFVLYTIYRFGWSERTNGFSLAIFGALSVVSAVAVGRLVERFGPRVVVVTGFTLGIAGFVTYGFAPTGLLFACALPLTGFWAIAGPPLQSAMSRRVEPSEQGELQGAIGSMRSIATIVGPAFFTLLFAAVSARGSYPLVGAPWFCGAALLAAAIVFARRAIAAEPPGSPIAREPEVTQ